MPENHDLIGAWVLFALAVIVPPAVIAWDIYQEKRSRNDRSEETEYDLIWRD